MTPRQAINKLLRDQFSPQEIRVAFQKEFDQFLVLEKKDPDKEMPKADCYGESNIVLTMDIGNIYFLDWYDHHKSCWDLVPLQKVIWWAELPELLNYKDLPEKKGKQLKNETKP